MNSVALYQLTIDALSVSAVKQYAVPHDFPEVAPLVAAWTTLFGGLNQTYLLQRLAPEVRVEDIAAPSFQPALQSRSVQLLRGIRPFHASRSEDQSLHEMRTYDLMSGSAPRFMELLRGILDFRERLSPCLGAWASITGRSDQVLHIWSYRSLEERDAVREQLLVDPIWRAYSEQVAPLIVNQRNTLLKPR